MINRIASVKAPGNGRRRPLPDSWQSPQQDQATAAGWGGRIEEFFGDHPVMSLAIGFTVGIVVGCLVKRR